MLEKCSLHLVQPVRGLPSAEHNRTGQRLPHGDPSSQTRSSTRSRFSLPFPVRDALCPTVPCAPTAALPSPPRSFPAPFRGCASTPRWTTRVWCDPASLPSKKTGEQMSHVRWGSPCVTPSPRRSRRPTSPVPPPGWNSSPSHRAAQPGDAGATTPLRCCAVAPAIARSATDMPATDMPATAALVSLSPHVAPVARRPWAKWNARTTWPDRFVPERTSLGGGLWLWTTW